MLKLLRAFKSSAKKEVEEENAETITANAV